MHIAIGMAFTDIIGIEAIMLLVEDGRAYTQVDILVASRQSPLTAVGGKIVNRDAYGNAGAAALAVGAIEVAATTPETQ
jgi:hypothetical protein